MDKKLLHKYFNDQCSEEELEQVLHWFQTKEGQRFIEDDINNQLWQPNESVTSDNDFDIASWKILNRILIHKNREPRRRGWVSLRVASIIVIFGLLSLALYKGGVVSFEKDSTEPVTLKYSTQANQQKIVTLDEGTTIRLNENSSLSIPKTLTDDKRQVELRGEAYFKVTHDPEHPFVVKTIGSRIRVLGTKFNVKSGTIQNNVEVAVIEGKVALASASSENVAKAVLSRNNFGTLRLSDSQITIEEVNTRNYISWIHKRLKFSGENLQNVSQQLERLYDVEITFETSSLKKLNLTADIEKDNLSKVLTTIAKTFDISYRIDGKKIIWTH